MDNDVLMENYAATMRGQGLSPVTVQSRTSALRMMSRYCTSLRTATIFELRGFLGREGITNGTRRGYRIALQGFYGYLVEDGYRDDNPAAKLKKITVPRGTPRPFTPEQIELLLNTGAYRKTRAMILLGYYQGFRVSQIARVRGDDIDVDSMRIRTLAKGSKDGVLPLHPVIAELSKSMPDGWWFPARDGRDAPVLARSVSDLISEAKKRAGITDPKLTAHSLRHSMGTHLVDAGVDIRVISELMMHESVATTQIYTNVSEQLKTEGLGKLTSLSIPKHSGRLAA